MVSSSVELLNTSQAAEVAGVSLTYMRRLTDAGTIPVQSRGTHRRIRLSDVLGLAGNPHRGSGRRHPGGGAGGIRRLNRALPPGRTARLSDDVPARAADRRGAQPKRSPLGWVPLARRSGRKDNQRRLSSWPTCLPRS